MKSIPISILWLVTLQFCWCSQASVEICSTFSCNPTEQDTIMFPFHVPRNQSNRCGYPGFDLTCGRNGQTFLNLSSKPLTVKAIWYTDQLLLVSDPDKCIPKRLLTLNLTSTPFSYGAEDMPPYTFLNCSRTKITNLDTSPFPWTSVVACLSGSDYTVLTTLEKESEEELVDKMKCKVMKRVNAAFWWKEMYEGYFPPDMSDVSLQLGWSVPNCGDCVLNGGVCSFVNDSDLAVACFFPPDSSGLPRSAKYALVLGAGIPAIICMIGLTYYISSRARARNQNRGYPNIESSPAIFPQPMILTVGLDRPTIESYPKTILGESKRFPNTSDGTCPICLSDYLPKETLRSIPECNHFFHADCIDEWLRMNATCPLCRKSPQ
ncbi:RING-H2 finger protein ATL20-like [Silene latifolia]|uniref:RING-H2 finger protein ATL20-like n=1 Tax=Silene latifolia TaxID=37657 RepID=UPI003D78A2DA